MKANKPNKNHLIEKASLVGMVALTKNQHDQLLSKICEPRNNSSDLDFDTIVKSASHSGYELIKKEDLIEMQSLLENPTIKLLTEHAEKQNHVILPKQQFIEMERSINSPSLEFLIQHSNKNEHRLIPEYDYKDIREKIDNPSIDFIRQKVKVRS